MGAMCFTFLHVSHIFLKVYQNTICLFMSKIYSSFDSLVNTTYIYGNGVEQ